jgi:hypothetical protein
MEMTVVNSRKSETDRFTFCAKDSSSEEQDVKIVMPLGGSESGLFRYPKVGEKVLVSQSSSGVYYLIGYLPSTDTDTKQNFTTDGKDKNDVFKNQGEVFRYEKTGSNDAADKYSEIGFYNDQTQWKKDGQKDEDAPLQIDRINIQSTGDIYEKAQNYNGVQAKRMEITIGKDALPQKAKAGDLSIDAKHDITISSDSSITLKVGRSSISINDTGIIIKSAKINSPIGNTWDSALTITPLDGIVMNGPHAKITAVNDFSLTDGYGGSVSSDIGVTRIGGIDIKMATSGLPAYIKGGFLQGLDLGLNIASMAAGIGVEAGDKSSDKNAKNIGSGVAGSLSSVIKGAYGKHQDAASGSGYISGEYSDAIGALIGGMKLATQIAGAVASVLSLTASLLGSAGSTGKKSISYVRDSINMALAITESGLALGAASVIAGFKLLPSSAAIPIPDHKATIHLQANAMLYYDSLSSKETVQVKDAYDAPLAGMGLLGNISGKYPWFDASLKFSKSATVLGMKYYSDPELDKL